MNFAVCVSIFNYTSTYVISYRKKSLLFAVKISNGFVVNNGELGAKGKIPQNVKFPR